MNRVGFHSTHETQPSRMLYLDSADANHLTQLTSHYAYSFKDEMETGNAEGVLVSLSSASIPYSFYNIRSDVNTKLHYDTGGVALDPIEITPGNYSANALSKAIIAGFAAKGVTMTAEYQKITQKYKFACGSTLNFKFAYPILDAALMDEIGFGGASESVVISVGGTQSPHVADLNGSVHAIFVRTNLATKSVMESMTQGVSDVLAKIDINSDPGGVITLDPNQVSHESLIHTSGIKQIEIKLTDERNRLLDLNGLHTQLGIKFRFVSTKIAEPIVALGADRQRVSPKEVAAQQSQIKQTKNTKQLSTRKK